MQVKFAEFVKSALRDADFPRDRRPEIAFLGRSNVGKSSLLNTLLGRKGLAKTSGTPGKTQTINFFSINNSFYFVDLPGYGFAKVPKSLKTEWNRVMAQYLQSREPLRLACALLDARHPPSEQDEHMIAVLAAAQVPTLLVATKVDKLKRSERNTNFKRIREAFGLDDEALLIAFSSVTGEGKREMWQVIEERLQP